jgi:hypothetical protein
MGTGERRDRGLIRRADLVKHVMDERVGSRSNAALHLVAIVDAI